MFWSLILIAALMCVFYLWSWRRNAMLHIPGPTPFPIIGTFYDIDMKWASGTFYKFAQTYGKVFRVNWPEPVVVLGDPDVLKQVLGSDYENWNRDPRTIDYFRDIAGIVVVNNGPHWKFIRDLFTPAFAYENLIKLRVLVLQKARQLANQLEKFAKSGEPVDLQQWAKKFTFDVIGIVVLGKDFNGLDFEGDSPYEKAWAHILEHSMHKFMLNALPYWKLFTTDAERRYEESMKLMQESCRQQIAAAKAKADPNDATMVGHLVRNEQARAWPEDEQVRQLMGFLFAGHDTTATGIGWTLYKLATHPEVEKKLVAELKSTPMTDDNLTDVDKMPYLKAVINESLRIDPPALSNGRTPKESRTLEWTTNQGEKRSGTIPSGTSCQLSYFVLSRDPVSWPEPEKFDPERFLVESPQRHPYAFIPFGAGPRRCIGERLALIELRTALVALLQKFKFEALETPKRNQKATLHAENGIMMRITLRQ